MGWLIIGLLAFLAFFSSIAQAQTAVQKIESVGFTVSDMDKTIDFYTRILPSSFSNYLVPTAGKPFPTDTRSNDLWHWQTSFVAPKVDSLALTLLKNKYDFISTGMINFSDTNSGFNKALLVRDMDGHAVRIVGN